MRTPLPRQCSSSSPTKTTMGKEGLKTLLSEAELLVREWQKKGKNPAALLVAFKRVYGMDKTCTTTLWHGEKGDSEFTVSLSKEVVSPLLPLISDDFDGRKGSKTLKTLKASLCGDGKKGSNKGDDDEEEEEEEEERDDASEEEDEEEEEVEDKNNDPFDFDKSKRNQRAPSKKNKKRKSKDRVVVVRQSAKSSARGVVHSLVGKKNEKKTRAQNRVTTPAPQPIQKLPPPLAPVPKPNPVPSNVSPVVSGSPAASGNCTPAILPPTPVTSSRSLSSTPTAPATSSSSTPTISATPALAVPPLAPPTSDSTQTVSSTPAPTIPPPNPALATQPPTKTKKDKQDDLKFCKDFLKDSYGRGTEAIEVTMEAWFSVQLSLTPPSSAAEPSTQQHPVERDNDNDSSPSDSVPTLSLTPPDSSSSALVSLVSEEIKRLFAFLADVRLQKKEVQRKRWKAEYLLCLRVYDLRDTIEREKKQWKEVQEALCKELDCKKTRMKQIVTAGKLFCKLGILMFPTGKIPHHKALDRFAKRYSPYLPVLQQEFPFLQEKTVPPKTLLHALGQPTTTGIAEVARMFQTKSVLTLNSLSSPSANSSAATDSSVANSSVSSANSSAANSSVSSPSGSNSSPPQATLGKRSSPSPSLPSSEPQNSKKQKTIVVEDPSSQEPAVSSPVVGRQALDNLKQGKEADDEVIMFYAKRLLKQSAPEVQAKVHLFDSQCFPIVERVRKDRSDAEKDRAVGGTKDDFFEKEHLIFPVNDAHHWFLAIVDHPRRVTEEGCRLRIMDSLCSLEKPSTLHERASDKIADLLNRALLKSNETRRPFDRKSLKIEMVKVPQQRNGVDCGLFMLKCLEKFLASPDLKVWSLSFIHSLGLIVGLRTSYSNPSLSLPVKKLLCSARRFRL